MYFLGRLFPRVASLRSLPWAKFIERLCRSPRNKRRGHRGRAMYFEAALSQGGALRAYPGLNSLNGYAVLRGTKRAAIETARYIF